MANEKRLIDVGLILQQLHEEGGCDAEKNSWSAGWDEAINRAYHIVECAPTVDAVEVVRCKDCKHCEPAINSYNKKIMECQNSNGIWRKVKPDDFCSYGERREGE